jgi:hypothetical protein
LFANHEIAFKKKVELVEEEFENKFKASIFKFEGREQEYRSKIACLQQNLSELTAKLENAK